jgi:hypothetical protein
VSLPLGLHTSPFLPHAGPQAITVRRPARATLPPLQQADACLTILHRQATDLWEEAALLLFAEPRRGLAPTRGLGGLRRLGPRRERCLDGQADQQHGPQHTP